MSKLSSIGLGIPSLSRDGQAQVSALWRRRILRSVLSFTGYTIHDVINDRSARNTVLLYYRLYRQIERRCAQPVDQPDRGRIQL